MCLAASSNSLWGLLFKFCVICLFIYSMLLKWIPVVKHSIFWNWKVTRGMIWQIGWVSHCFDFLMGSEIASLVTMNEKDHCLDHESTCIAIAPVFSFAFLLLNTLFVCVLIDQLPWWKMFMVQDARNVKKHTEHCLYFGGLFVVCQYVGHQSSYAPVLHLNLHSQSCELIPTHISHRSHHSDH
jgi:hypothetical protein